MKPHSSRHFSLILPAYNEATLVEGAARSYHTHLLSLQKQGLFEKFEILVVFNGCTDRSDQLLKNFEREFPEIKIESIPERGLGRAIRRGIERASGSYGMFYSIDIPFGLQIIEQSLNQIFSSKNIGMVIGSKAHPESQVHRPWIRQFVSTALNTILRLLLKIQIKDTQGSQCFLLRPLKENIALLQSPGPFLQVELILVLQKLGYQILEIPIRHIEKGRPSKMKILKDAIQSLRDIFRAANEWNAPRARGERDESQSNHPQNKLSCHDFSIESERVERREKDF